MAPTADTTREITDPMTYRVVVDVYLALRRPDGAVLLAERANTGYADGWYTLPSGKLEDGETAHDAAVREAAEEIGVRVDPRDVRFVTVVHHRGPEGNGRVGFFFVTDTWRGDPVNAEPHKCAGLAWAHPAAPPSNTWPYTVAGLTQLLPGGVPYLAHGWHDPEPDGLSSDPLAATTAPSSGSAEQAVASRP